MTEPATDPSSTFQPLEFALERGTALTVRWSDGLETRIPLARLRRECPCAGCRHEREEQATRTSGLPVMPAGRTDAVMATAETAELVGTYALRIFWKDGHSTGIYNYEFLRQLGEQPA